MRQSAANVQWTEYGNRYDSCIFLFLLRKKNILVPFTFWLSCYVFFDSCLDLRSRVVVMHFTLKKKKTTNTIKIRQFKYEKATKEITTHLIRFNIQFVLLPLQLPIVSYLRKIRISSQSSISIAMSCVTFCFFQIYYLVVP